MFESDIKEDLLKKYQLAGRIRLMSFSVLFVFLFSLKWMGGYTYLNSAVLLLIFFEAIVNQPYHCIVQRVNIYRLQYYQITADVIVISWMLYYIGGIEAPVMTIAYYAVILWAGVTANVQTVFFAVTMSALFFSGIALLEHSGMLLPISFYNYEISDARFFSLLFGNIAYLFAFGYFSAYSAQVIHQLQRKRRDEALRYAHKFSAIDHIIANTTHDILACFANIKSATELLSTSKGQVSGEGEMLKMIVGQGDKAAELLHRLSRFSRKGEAAFKRVDINKIIEEAINLTIPVVRYSHMTIAAELEPAMPLVMANKDQMQGVFVAMILNSLDAIPGKGVLNIKTGYLKEKDIVEIILSDTGAGIKPEHLDQIAKPFFTTKGIGNRLGIGLAISYEIIAKHKGRIQVRSKEGQGTTIIIELPVERAA